MDWSWSTVQYISRKSCLPTVNRPCQISCSLQRWMLCCPCQAGAENIRLHLFTPLQGCISDPSSTGHQRVMLMFCPFRDSGPFPLFLIPSDGSLFAGQCSWHSLRDIADETGEKLLPSPPLPSPQLLTGPSALPPMPLTSRIRSQTLRLSMITRSEPSRHEQS